MFCSQCGAPGDGRFCQKCGAGLPTFVIENQYHGKAKQLTGWFLIIGGAISAIAYRDESLSFGISLIVAIVGLLLSLAGKVEHWYHAE